MMYDTQNYWGSGLCQSSGILKTIKCDVSETGSVSVLSDVNETPTLLGAVEKANLYHCTSEPLVSPFHHRWTETCTVSETLFSNI
jgi:hypothetical protein